MSQELEKTHKPILVTDSNGVHYEVAFDFPYSPPEIECNVDTNLITGGKGKINKIKIHSKDKTEIFKYKNIFFISDTHFSTQRTLELSRRPFDNIVEMDREMISNWNSQVQNDDIVIHLGDFGEFKDIRDKLNGNIILLFGNYERESKHDIYLKPQDTVFQEELSLVLEIENDQWELVHEPSNRITDLFYLFGHIHKTQQVKPNGLNVGVDCHDFKLLSYQDVLFYKQAIEKFYDSDVFGQF